MKQTDTAVEGDVNVERTLAEVQIIMGELPACIFTDTDVSVDELLALFRERLNRIPVGNRQEALQIYCAALSQITQKWEQCKHFAAHPEQYAVFHVEGLSTTRERLLEAGVL